MLAGARHFEPVALEVLALDVRKRPRAVLALLARRSRGGLTGCLGLLGFDPDLLEKTDLQPKEEECAMFVDFVRQMLTIDPDARPTAEEALRHPWILSSYQLTEDDIRYPPEDEESEEEED